MNVGKILIFLCSTVVSAFSGENLVFNGSFELLNPDGIPQGWSYAGNSAVKQRLSSDTGRDGGRCIKLECVEFAGDGPDYHAMICQVGRVSVRKGQWYKLTFWAKGEGIRGGAVDVALNNTSPWENVGLSEAF